MLVLAQVTLQIPVSERESDEVVRPLINLQAIPKYQRSTMLALLRYSEHHILIPTITTDTTYISAYRKPVDSMESPIVGRHPQ